MGKKNNKYYILPGVQAVGAVVLFFSQLNLPEEKLAISLVEAVVFLVAITLGIVLLRLAWIIFSSYIINMTKLQVYKYTNQQIVSKYLFPFFFYEGKWKLANVFWIYDDRTCFSMNKYLKSKESFKELCLYILKRNRILACTYCVITIIICFFCVYYDLLVIAWIVGVGAFEHFFYQMEYKKAESANGMAFAGLTKVDTKLMLHILSNQSKIEVLDVGEDIAKILAQEMLERDSGYFFNYLCLSAMFHEVCDGSNNYLSSYMKIKVEHIKSNSEDALLSVKYTERDPILRNIEKNVCLFYYNYREFLLYVLMYFKIKDENNEFKTLNNYINYMLERIENRYINDNVLSNVVLSENFHRYTGLYQNVLNYKFEAEKDIFTGYETLPVWMRQRDKFIKLYNGKKDRE